jgi:hypothetical protein
MSHIYHVGGYVKLAKLWERSQDKAVAYHNKYYKDKFANNETMQLVDVYIDITGNKHIFQRPEMLRLIRDCNIGRIDCIAAQTYAYLAPNMAELCYLLKYLSECKQQVEILTEDDYFQIDTISNVDGQREAMYKMKDNYIKLIPGEFAAWKSKVDESIKKLNK